MVKPKSHDLRIWHIPQVPMKPFYLKVENVDEAKFVLEALASYDDFQFKNKIKPDYNNAQGLEVFDGIEWYEWYNAEGQDILEVIDGNS